MANENTKRIPSKKVLAALIGLGFVLGLIGLLWSPDSEKPADPMVGVEAADFEFTSDGKTQNLSSLRGKVVLVNFWASWCEPCREEIPSLKKLEAHLADQEFVLLMVHVGDEKEEALKVPGLPSKVVFDVAPSVLSDYGVNALPQSFLVDRQGVLRAIYRGPKDWMSSDVLKQIQEPLS